MSTGRYLQTAVLALCCLLVGLTVCRMTRSWPNEAHLSYAEGVWIGLALDTAHGTFYRPLDGPEGYGGTRYFPLFFSLHAGLIRAGFNAIWSGYVLAAS